MNYYALIKNALGQWSIYAQGIDRDEAVQALSKLTNAGFPRKDTKIVRGLSGDGCSAFVTIIFTTFDGQSSSYPVTSPNPLKDFHIAVEWALTRQLKNIKSVIMYDNRNVELYHFNFGKIFQPLQQTKMNTEVMVGKNARIINDRRFSYRN